METWVLCSLGCGKRGQDVPSDIDISYVTTTNYRAWDEEKNRDAGSETRIYGTQVRPTMQDIERNKD